MIFNGLIGLFFYNDRGFLFNEQGGDISGHGNSDALYEVLGTNYFSFIGGCYEFAYAIGFGTLIGGFAWLLFTSLILGGINVTFSRVLIDVLWFGKPFGIGYDIKVYSIGGTRVLQGKFIGSGGASDAPGGLVITIFVNRSCASEYIGTSGAIVVDRGNFILVARGLVDALFIYLGGYWVMETGRRVLYEGNGKLAIEQLWGIIYDGRWGSYFYLYFDEGQCIGDRLITIGINIVYDACG